MDRIYSEDVILDEVNRIRHKAIDFQTNFFYNQKRLKEWISLGKLFIRKGDRCSLLFRKEDSYISLYYIASDLDSLYVSVNSIIDDQKYTYVTDIVGSQNSIVNATNVFANLGFEHYKSLFRMSKCILANEDSVMQYEDDPNIQFADICDTDDIYSLFFEYFDPLCEQLPSKYELQELISNNNIMLYRINGEIASVVLYELTKQSLYFRYWITLPQYRDQKIGAKLYRRLMYLARSTRKHMLWVLSDNHNAIIRHEHYGFIREQLYDNVMLLRRVNNN